MTARDLETEGPVAGQLEADLCWGCPFMRICPHPDGCPNRSGDYGPADAS